MLSYNKIINYGFLLFYPVTMLHWLLQFSGYRFTILTIFLRVVLLSGFLLLPISVRKSPVSQMLVIFIFYNLLSIVFVISSDIWLEGYFYDVLNFIIPMSAFFVGSCSVVDKSKFYNVLLYSTIFCCVFGLGMLVFSSGWYFERLSIVSQDLIGTEIGDQDAALQLTRFSSFLYSPYGIQYFGIPSLAILLYRMYVGKADDSKVVLLLEIVFLIILVVSIILCQQRVSWGYMAILLVTFGFLALRTRTGKKIVMGVFFAIIIGIAYFASNNFSDNNTSLIEPLTSRFAEMSISKAMSGRTDQYASLLNNWNRPILGYGMGTGGATARIAGLPGASDAGYMKILYENGIVGVIIFLLIIVPSVFRILQYPKLYMTEGHVLLFFIVAMLGSNALSMSVYYTVILWFALGVIWRPNNLSH